MSQCLEKKMVSQEACSTNANPPTNRENIDQNRRSIVRKIAVGSAAVACCSIIPARWTPPIVEFGSLPAHAATSGIVAEIVEKVKKELEPEAEEAPQVTKTPEAGFNQTEVINRTGDIYIDGIIRSKYISPKNGRSFGKTILVVFSSGVTMAVPDTSHDVNSVSGKGYRPGGNHPEIPTMEVYADIGDHPAYITIHYNG